MTEFRVAPSSPFTWAACQLRRTPSKRPPIRSIARRERSLRSSVLRSSRRTPHTSKAVGHHEQLRLGIGGRSLGRGGEERAADLRGVGELAREDHRNVRNLVMPMISDVSLRRVAKGTAQR